MNHLKEIMARKAEIRSLLESTTEVDLVALETELRALDTEKESIEKRAELLKTVEQAYDTSTEEIRTVHKPEERMPAEPKTNKRLRLFENFGQQLAAIKRHATGAGIDERQQRLENECRALGMNQGIGSEGGLVIQTDFAGTMMESAATAGNILPLVDRYDISANANSVEWVEIDETSVATSVFGGVQVYWAAEAAEVTATAPKLLEKELKLNKLMGVAYATHELEQNSSFVSDLYSRAFQLAINRELEACILSGTGVGKPKGMITSGHAVEIAKETGQPAATVKWENIVKMSNAAIDKQKSLWLIHPDVQQQLDFLEFPVGVGGLPVYLPASSIGSLSSLKGRPIIESDHCSAIGTAGDINFVDFSDYMMIFKGGLQQDYSIHVQFLTAQNCFRFIFYANGMPKRTDALTIKNSATKRSSCVRLATRS